MKGIVKKRKGFTLIELIAVMAILAVLGAILVPKITGYKAKAQKSNIQSSAKTLLNTIDAYNSDKDVEKQLCVTVTPENTWQTQINDLCNGEGEEGKILEIEKIPACLGGKPAGYDGTKEPDKSIYVIDSYDNLKKVASGEFIISKTDGLKTAIIVNSTEAAK